MNKKDFDVVRSQGNFRTFPYFTINFLNRLDEEEARIGVIVSKKISTKAVTRNKIRRQIKEAVRINKLMEKSYDYVIIVKPSITRLNYGRIEAELKNAFRFL
ncbi:MAG TPA: ribonuclease P protein component [Patescibacteria group bacterium]|nr:ribonuclease P protein component [Patescibacteria group bacterium]